MPVLTITAVDPATDQLTVPAHGLTTGDGFIAAYTPNGALPGGLAAVTNYWAIRVDANTVRLATSSTNALAGVAIDITDAGSGTLQLLQGSPYRVPTIAGPGSQIKSAHLNATWGSLVDLWNLLTGQAQSTYDGIKLAAGKTLRLQGGGYIQHDTRTLQIPASQFVSLGDVASVQSQYSVDLGISPVSAGPPLNVIAPIVLTEGKRILAVRVYVKDSATGPTKVQSALYDTSPTNAGVVVAASAVSAGSGANQTLAITGLTEVVQAAHAYSIVINTATGAAAVNCYFAEVDYDAP